MSDELFNDPRHVRSDMKTIQQMIKNGWNVPENIKQLVMDYCLETLADKRPNRTRHKAAAARTVLTMTGQDQADYQLFLKLQNPEHPQVQINVGANLAPADLATIDRIIQNRYPAELRDYPEQPQTPIGAAAVNVLDPTDLPRPEASPVRPETVIYAEPSQPVNEPSDPLVNLNPDTPATGTVPPENPIGEIKNDDNGQDCADSQNCH